MKYRLLGNTGLFVSELCMGTMTFGGKGIFELIGALKQESADELVNRALDAGINFFDTADAYAHHESETMLGKALGNRRKDVIVATKVRGRMGDNVNCVGLTRHHIMNQVDKSLKALGTDYIDLYQIHSVDPITPIEETLGALNDLVRQGKVRYIGCSNLFAWQIMKALGISRLNGWTEFCSIQAYYSIAGRELEREIVPLAQDQKLAILPWSPLAGGFLSGKFTRENEGSDADRRKNFDFPPVNKEKGYDIVEVMQQIAKEKNVSVAQIALAWLLHKPAVTSVIIGAKKMSQLEDNLKAIDLELSQQDMQKLDEASQITPEYPAWISQGVTDRLPGQKGWSQM